MATALGTRPNTAVAASFLDGRKMHIKLPRGYSKVYDMPGGTPQGTKCSNVLFCVATADLTDLREEPENVQIAKVPSALSRKKTGAAHPLGADMT